MTDQRTRRCPFLSSTLGHDQECVKAENSKGVCSISAASNGPRQDWLVCPYRALDDDFLAEMVRRLYKIEPSSQLLIVPAVTLADAAVHARVLQAARRDSPERVFAYFQDKLGGEIGLSKTPASPELSFDITIVELFHHPGANGSVDVDSSLTVGRYGVIELQTTDTHGSYRHSVEALRNALDLHSENFAEQLGENSEWAGRRIEGPNISNVFKRTFYQLAFKFQVTKRDTSAGCVLALPRPVWDSWQPFLGAPDVHQQPDGTWRLLDDQKASPNDWIYVFDIDEEPSSDGGPAAVRVDLVIGTDAATLSRAALDVAPANAIKYGGADDAVVAAIVRRLRTYLPNL